MRELRAALRKPNLPPPLSYGQPYAEPGGSRPSYKKNTTKIFFDKGEIPLLRLFNVCNLPSQYLLQACAHTAISDDDSVHHRENIKGMRLNIAFIDHSAPERNGRDMKSHWNPVEAELEIRRAVYLRQQGYSAGDVSSLAHRTITGCGHFRSGYSARMGSRSTAFDAEQRSLRLPTALTFVSSQYCAVHFGAGLLTSSG